MQNDEVFHLSLPLSFGSTVFESSSCTQMVDALMSNGLTALLCVSSVSLLVLVYNLLAPIEGSAVNGKLNVISRIPLVLFVCDCSHAAGGNIKFNRDLWPN